MAEMYIADIIKRALNANYGWNFTLLQYGTFAAARRAEMALQADQREYLGQTVPGGQVEEDVSSILARFAATSSSVATTAAATATRMAPRRLTAAERAENMDFGSFVKGLLTLLFSPVNFLIAVVWGWLVNLVIILKWTVYAIPVLVAVYFAFQGVSYLAAFEQVQRRVWYEDLNEQFGIGRSISAFATGLLKVLGWIIAAPFLIAAWIYRTIRDSDGLQDLYRRAKRAIGAELSRTINDLRFNAITDWITLHYWRTTVWFGRNAFRIFFAGMGVWFAWMYLSRMQEEEGIVRFESVHEMAAYFDVPQSALPNEARGGSRNHYRWDGREVGDAVLGNDVVEERMAIEDSFSEAQTVVKVVEQVGEPTSMAEEGAEMVQTAAEPAEQTSDTISKPGKTAMGEGWVGYCRKCRQRHCCEAVDQPPAPTVLFPEL